MNKFYFSFNINRQHSHQIINCFQLIYIKIAYLIRSEHDWVITHVRNLNPIFHYYLVLNPLHALPQFMFFHISFQLHRLTEDKETPENEHLPVMPHMSQHKTRGTCNCGNKQMDRDDPFDHKVNGGGV